MAIFIFIIFFCQHKISSLYKDLCIWHSYHHHPVRIFLWKKTHKIQDIFVWALYKIQVLVLFKRRQEFFFVSTYFFHTTFETFFQSTFWTKFSSYLINLTGIMEWTFHILFWIVIRNRAQKKSGFFPIVVVVVFYSVYILIT